MKKNESTTKIKKHRTLGSLERFFWLLDHHHPLHFSIAAELNGTAPVEQWFKALNAIKEQHPLLRVSINLNENNAPVFVPLAGDVPIPLRIVQDTENNSWKAELKQEHITRFSPSEGPLIRAVLYECPHRSVIILSAHHSIADGRSLSYVLNDLLNAMNGKFTEPNAMPLATDEQVGLIMDDLHKLPINEADFVFLEGNSTVERALPQVDTLRLSPELSTRVRQRARQEGTTVHGALSAALALVSKDWKPQPLRIWSPASARETLESGYSASLQLTTKTVSFDLEEHRTFWDVARYSNASLAGVGSMEYITGYTQELSGLISSGIDINGLVEFGETVIANEYLLTNIGALNFDTDFGKLQLEALWGPFVLTGYEGSQTIGVTSINGIIHLALTTLAHIEAKPLLEAVEDLLMEECALVDNLR